MSKPRILIGSPIRQTPVILKLFLDSLRWLEGESYVIDYVFVDDNTDPLSSDMLRQFAASTGRTSLLTHMAAVGSWKTAPGGGHLWLEDTVWKVAAMKDRILAMGQEGGYTHVFLADSDLLFHPHTLTQLLQAGQDVVSTIYWTRWQVGTTPMPQVWLHGEYETYPLIRQQETSEHDRRLASQRFFAELRVPGLYEVGGLGACTLISRQAIERGVSFREIPNLSYWGEDRHFCVRAAALGIGLFVDTTYPAYHIYREEDLVGAAVFIAAKGDTQRLPVESRDAYGRGVELMEYGFELLAMEAWEESWSSREGDARQQVQVLLELDAYYGRQGDMSRGRALLLEGMEGLPYAELHCRLGSKCMDIGNWQEAAAWFRAAIGTPRPDDWERSIDVSSWTWKPYIQLCVCTLQLGDPLRAFEYNERGLMFEPDHPTMLANREALLAMLAEQRSTTA